MDIKLINSTGDLYINDKNDLEFFTEQEKDFEVIQNIVTMLNIRAGELVYDVNYGLDFNILFEKKAGNTEEIKQHIKTQIFNNFSDYIEKITNVESVFEDRKLSLQIDFEFKNERKYRVKGVRIAWQG